MTVKRLYSGERSGRKDPTLVEQGKEGREARGLRGGDIRQFPALLKGVGGGEIWKIARLPWATRRIATTDDHIDI